MKMSQFLSLPLPLKFPWPIVGLSLLYNVIHQKDFGWKLNIVFNLKHCRLCNRSSLVLLDWAIVSCFSKTSLNGNCAPSRRAVTWLKPRFWCTFTTYRNRNKRIIIKLLIPFAKLQQIQNKGHNPWNLYWLKKSFMASLYTKQLYGKLLFLFYPHLAIHADFTCPVTITLWAMLPWNALKFSKQVSQILAFGFVKVSKSQNVSFSSSRLSQQTVIHKPASWFISWISLIAFSIAIVAPSWKD